MTSVKEIFTVLPSTLRAINAEIGKIEEKRHINNFSTVPLTGVKNDRC